MRLPLPDAALGVDDADQLFQALALRRQHAPAEPGETIVAAPRVVELGRGPVNRFFDEVCIDESLQRAVEGCRPESHFAVSAVEDFLHDAVPVLIFAGEGKQDVEPVRLERQEGFRLRRFGHARFLYQAIYILMRTMPSTDVAW